MEGIPEKDMDERRRLLEQKTQGKWKHYDIYAEPLQHDPSLIRQTIQSHCICSCVAATYSKTFTWKM